MPWSLIYGVGGGGPGANITINNLPVTSGEQLSIYAGQAGGDSSFPSGGQGGCGFHSGGHGGSGYYQNQYNGAWGASGGGGSSAIVAPGGQVLAEAGGGGGDFVGFPPSGGAGGTPDGQAGVSTCWTYISFRGTSGGWYSIPAGCDYGGGGATQTADGEGGQQSDGYAGNPPPSETYNEGGGGGGGGYYGGGGGSNQSTEPFICGQGVCNFPAAGAGGGGSSFVINQASGVSYSATSMSNGSVNISWP